MKYIKIRCFDFLNQTIGNRITNYSFAMKKKTIITCSFQFSSLVQSPKIVGDLNP